MLISFSINSFLSSLFSWMAVVFGNVCENSAMLGKGEQPGEGMVMVAMGMGVPPTDMDGALWRRKPDTDNLDSSTELIDSLAALALDPCD